MTLPQWREEPISKSHDRAAFDCGDVAMNDFLRRYARQAHEQGASKTFCAIGRDAPNRILGFYTIAPSAVARDKLPASISKGTGQYEVSGFKLARIATDLTVARQGLGGVLLATAALRCLRAATEVGGILMIIDAKSARAAEWYARYGAEPIIGKPLTLVLPLAIFVDDLRRRRLL